MVHKVFLREYLFSVLVSMSKFLSPSGLVSSHHSLNLIAMAASFQHVNQDAEAGEEIWTDANQLHGLNPTVFQSSYAATAFCIQEPPGDNEQVDRRHPFPRFLPPNRGPAAPKPSILSPLLARNEPRQMQNRHVEFPTTQVGVSTVLNIPPSSLWLLAYLACLDAADVTIMTAIYLTLVLLTLFLGRHIIAHVLKFAAWFLLLSLLTIFNIGLVWLILLSIVHFPFLLPFYSVAACMTLFTGLFAYALVQAIQAARATS
ncbi:hypothetical protein PV10_09143 [Exophiala mesophila]|uniref:Uncharacterized protein n=1 Tax=Exophiala mesophila TaxID=212818 RepID=A0A0D1XJ56_EXOME|nr:uncharacterized protein PV10_09143 [Exophiala mesophila]KIV88226.1 hypothetical protein PV10_09143 [Exophiala mesophila]